MSKTIEGLIDKTLTQMFKAAGLDWDIAKIKTFCEADDWFTKYSWTEEQEKGFTNWMDTELKAMGWNTVARQREIGMFLLNYGWKRG